MTTSWPPQNIPPGLIPRSLGARLAFRLCPRLRGLRAGVGGPLTTKRARGRGERDGARGHRLVRMGRLPD